jgi:hypothetical protein
MIFPAHVMAHGTVISFLSGPLSCRWGETTSLNYGHQRAYYSFPVIYEHEEPLWNDIGRRKFLIRPPQRSLAILPAGVI